MEICNELLLLRRDHVYEGDGGDMSPQCLDRGGHDIFCLPQHFVIKSNVSVQISW